MGCRAALSIVSAWLRRNVHHVCDGGPRRLLMYLETVNSATSKPSLRSSPWMRGAPHKRALLAHPANEFAQLAADFWPTRSTAGFPAPISSKPSAMPAQNGVGLNHAGQSDQAWPQPRQPYQHGPVATMRP